jgi:two-component system chemotaxis response regulator CheY
MVTTQAAKEDVIIALQAGVNDYLIKPFTPEALKEKIQSLTRKS